MRLDVRANGLRSDSIAKQKIPAEEAEAVGMGKSSPEKP